MRNHVDETSAYAKTKSIDYILRTHNLFQLNVSVTYAKENNSQSLILFIRNRTSLNATIYQKNKDNDYIPTETHLYLLF